MVLKNWYIALCNTAMGGSYKLLKYINKTGVEVAMSTATPNLMIQFGANNAVCPTVKFIKTSENAAGGALFGTGNTPPTMNDYWLSGTAITTLSGTVAFNASFDNGKATTTATYTLTNTGDSDVTISEVGLVGNLYGGTGNTSASWAAMFERTVLDTPVTIPAGGIGQVTYSITHTPPIF